MGNCCSGGSKDDETLPLRDSGVESADVGSRDSSRFSSSGNGNADGRKKKSRGDASPRRNDVPASPSRPPRISRDEFATLLKILRETPFSSQIMDVLQNYAERYTFTLDLLREIFDVLDLSDDKMQATRILCGRIDFANSNVRIDDIVETLTFEYEKEQVRDYLESKK